MSTVLVVAPHPDDETLGCGGTLLRLKNEGNDIHWLIFTTLTQEGNFLANKAKVRDKEIKEVASRFQFESVHCLACETTKLDTLPIADLVRMSSIIMEDVKPEVVYIPFPGDIHSDHKVVFNVIGACTKWFRHRYVRKVLAYETISETEFGLNIDSNGFRPNVFVDISLYLNAKVDIMNIYKSEVGQFPFPRSEEAIRALAHLRGTTAGFKASEAFMLVKEVF